MNLKVSVLQAMSCLGSSYFCQINYSLQAWDCKSHHVQSPLDLAFNWHIFLFPVYAIQTWQHWTLCVFWENSFVHLINLWLTRQQKHFIPVRIHSHLCSHLWFIYHQMSLEGTHVSCPEGRGWLGSNMSEGV